MLWLLGLTKINTSSVSEQHKLLFNMSVLVGFVLFNYCHHYLGPISPCLWFWYNVSVHREKTSLVMKSRKLSTSGGADSHSNRKTSDS